MDTTVIWRAWSYHFHGDGWGYPVWALLYGKRYWKVPRAGAVRLIARSLNVSPKSARSIIRRGEGRFWRSSGGRIKLRSESALRRTVHNEGGVKKRSRFQVGLKDYTEGVQAIRAILSLPVMMALDADAGTPRTYTAKALGVSLQSVSRYRGILRRRGLIQTKHRFVSAAAGEAGAFRKGRRWYRQIADAVTVGANLSVSRKALLRRARTLSPSGDRPNRMNRLAARHNRMAKAIRTSVDRQRWDVERFRPALEKLLGHRFRLARKADWYLALLDSENRRINAASNGGLQVQTIEV